MQVAVSYLSFRFRGVRPVLDGEPIVLVEDGKLIDAEPAARADHASRSSQEQARQSQIASLDEVRWAVLETSGQISFIPKQ